MNKFIKIIFFIYIVLSLIFVIEICKALSQENIEINQDSLDIINQDSLDIIKCKKYMIVLDAAHGFDVPGKRSPDGKFLEYKFSREIITYIRYILDSLNLKYGLSNPTNKEIGLNKRVYNTNNLIKKYGKKSLFVSIHVNASGMGIEWMNARGWSIYTTRGFTRGDQLAEKIENEFTKEFPEIKNRGQQEANFRVLLCKPPAVLIETLFQDNKKDVEILQSEDFKERYSSVIVKGIINFIIND